MKIQLWNILHHKAAKHAQKQLNWSNVDGMFVARWTQDNNLPESLNL